MRYLLWALKFALFAVVLVFALRNADMVTVHYPGGEWESPLVLVLLVAFCAGAVLGLAAVLPQTFRQRREISVLKRELRDAASARDAETARKPQDGSNV